MQKQRGKILPSLLPGNVTYFILTRKHYFLQHNNRFKTIYSSSPFLPAVLRESKQKQAAGCFFRAGLITRCCRWWAPAKHHCAPKKLFSSARLSNGHLYSLDASQYWYRGACTFSASVQLRCWEVFRHYSRWFYYVQLKLLGPDLQLAQTPYSSI